jgi:hypothetical protein
VATSWSALASLVSDAIEDQQGAGPGGGDPAEAGAGAEAPVSAGQRRARDIDATLAAAGIHPGHESLFPGRRPTDG